MELAILVTAVLTIAVICLWIGDALQKRRAHRAAILPYGVHVLASLFFCFGVFVTVYSWDKVTGWRDMIRFPLLLPACVYAAGLFFVLRFPDRRNALFKLLFPNR